jgi:hypothetical protein
VPRLRLPTAGSSRNLRALVLGLVLSLAVPAFAAARVPQGFVGMVLDGPLFPVAAAKANLADQLDQMVANGVESLRVSFDWAYAQPYASWRDVPLADASEFVNVGGIPTRFAAMDQLIGLAAQRGLTVMPIVIDAPSWDAERHKGTLVAVPKANAPYAHFLTALVRRYGSRGSFWQDHSPTVAVRMWQIWNEPNITAFWPVQPFEPRYVGLLRAANAAIKSADPSAKVVLAGMPNFSWTHLTKLYKIRGARGLFDVVAIHPYTRQPQGVITILTKVRQVMNAAGDTRKPILADEVSWPSSVGRTFHQAGFDFATTEAGQARNLSTLLPMLGKDRVRLGLLGFYYYTWAGTERRNGLAFDFAGLLRFSSGIFVKKPAFGVFHHWALTLESCRKKGLRATICLQPG